MSSRSRVPFREKREKPFAPISVAHFPRTSSSLPAVGPEDAGFCPVIKRPSRTTREAEFVLDEERNDFGEANPLLLTVREARDALAPNERGSVQILGMAQQRAWCMADEGDRLFSAR
jgi:hypothetical protein